MVRAVPMSCFAHNVALQLQFLLEFYFLSVLTQQAPISTFNFLPLLLKSEFPDLAYVSLTTLPLCNMMSLQESFVINTSKFANSQSVSVLSKLGSDCFSSPVPQFQKLL